MPTEAPSPSVRLSRDVIFSRAVLCRHVEEELFPFLAAPCVVHHALPAIRLRSAQCGSTRLPPNSLPSSERRARCDARARRRKNSVRPHTRISASSDYSQVAGRRLCPWSQSRLTVVGCMQYEGVKENEVIHLRTAVCRRVSLRAC